MSAVQLQVKPPQIKKDVPKAPSPPKASPPKVVKTSLPDFNDAWSPREEPPPPFKPPVLDDQAVTQELPASRLAHYEPPPAPRQAPTKTTPRPHEPPLAPPRAPLFSDDDVTPPPEPLMPPSPRPSPFAQTFSDLDVPPPKPPLKAIAAIGVTCFVLAAVFILYLVLGGGPTIQTDSRSTQIDNDSITIQIRIEPPEAYLVELKGVEVTSKENPKSLDAQGMVSYDISTKGLKLGANEASLKVVTNTGSDKGAFPIPVFYDYQRALSFSWEGKGGGEPTIHVDLETAPDSKVECKEHPPQKKDAGKWSIAIPLSKLQGQLERFSGKEFALNFGFDVIRGEGTAVKAREVVLFPVPRVNLEIDHPKDKLLTQQKKMEIAGLTELGAKVMVNTLPATVQEDGKFTATVELKKGENAIQIRAEKEGLIASGVDLIITKE